MTGIAAHHGKKPFAILGQRSAARVSSRPFPVVRRCHHIDPADHSRMFRAAILGAEKVVFPWGGGFKIYRGVAPWNGFTLHAEGGNGKAMENILRDQRHFDRDSRRNMQSVDLMLAAWVLRLPHPLLADYIDVHGIRRGVVDAEIEQRPPDEKYQKNSQRYQRPSCFQKG